MTISYKCSFQNCNENAVFYDKISKKIKPTCLKHHFQIKQRRLIKTLKKTGFQHTSNNGLTSKPTGQSRLFIG